MKSSSLVGVDEVGRGPLAGPVAVCAVCATRDTLCSLWEDAPFTDSKQMSEAARDGVFQCAEGYRKGGVLRYAISFISAPVIDRRGISWALKTAVGRALKRLAVEGGTPVLLDGSLYAPDEYVSQQTIPKGDRTEPAIALASVIAKVSRDRVMTRYCSQFPAYGFSRHKGYGTKEHQAALRTNGLCRIHRLSFCRTVERGPKVGPVTRK